MAYTTNYNFSHVTEQLLEEYVFSRLESSEANCVEEHLLICERCQATLAGIDEFIGALRIVIRDDSVPSSQDIMLFSRFH
jgi:anti-sigma factor RsiW